MKVAIQEDKLIINFKDLLHYFYEEMDEDQILNLIGYMAWLPKLFKHTALILADEFSRENYNQYIHESREDFLKKLKDEEIKYHSDRLASLIETRFREETNYWKLYHEFRERFGYEAIKRYPKPRKIDFDLRKELSQLIEKSFHIKGGNK